MKNSLGSKLGYFIKIIFLVFLGTRLGVYPGAFVSERLIFQSDRALILALLAILTVIAATILIIVIRLRKELVSVVDDEIQTNYGFAIISSTSLYFLIFFTLVGFSAPFVSGLLSVLLFEFVFT